MIWYRDFFKSTKARYKEAVEKPLISTTMQDPVEQRRIALAKAPLFFIALEDAYGEEPVRRGLAEVLTLLRGQSGRISRHPRGAGDCDEKRSHTHVPGMDLQDGYSRRIQGEIRGRESGK